MPSHVRLVHKMLDRYHVFTSPDLKGLHVSALSLAEAQREVIVVVPLIARELGQEPPVVSFPDLAVAA